MDTWRRMLEAEMRVHGETIGDIVSSTMSDEEMCVEFDSDYGSTNGIPFTVWTEKSVYFPVSYDGAEYVGRVARHPDGKPTDHI